MPTHCVYGTTRGPYGYRVLPHLRASLTGGQRCEFVQGTLPTQSPTAKQPVLKVKFPFADPKLHEAYTNKKRQLRAVLKSGKRGSNSRPQPWQGCALPTELFPHLLTLVIVKEMRLELTRPNGHYPLKVARLPIPPLLHNIIVKQPCAQNRTRTCTSLNTRT